MKDNNNMMMWVIAAAAAWFLFQRGTLDPYIGGFSNLFPGDEVVVNGNGDVVVVSENGEVVSGNGNGVGGITDWGDIYA